jgi:D-glycero-alpha-D-manno-heptose-7-phosphate kinase
MIVRSRAPLRISFGGGGTDVEPYLSEQGGMVLSATIDRYAYGSLSFPSDHRITAVSLDFDMIAKYNLDDPLVFDGRLDLVKAVVRRMNQRDGCEGLDFLLHSDAPPGSGLGSSSTLVVVLIGLFKHWLHLPLTSYDVADLAYQIERQDLGLEGGKQDQYAATFGGFNFIEFSRDATVVNPLRIPWDTVNELQYNLLLCYTGRTRLSARIIETQVESYVRRQEDVVRAMNDLKRIAVDLKNSLLQSRLRDVGGLLHDAWVAKRQMATQISDAHIDELYETARAHGAIGGKISGAGGGGYMFFYCDSGRKHVVSNELERLGAKVSPFNFNFDGLQTWEVR